MPIPKIIHQSYKTIDHPYPPDWQRSWRENHPNWSYRFYTDGHNRSIVEQHFPQFLETYDAFPHGIMRADFARLLYMYLWGGLYVDLDYVCLRPFDSLIGNINQMGIPVLLHNQYYQYHNALLISVPGNQFWLTCAEQAVAYMDQMTRPRVEKLAGPFRIQHEIEIQKPDFTPLSQEEVTPIDWQMLTAAGRPDLKTLRLARQLQGTDIADMQKLLPNAYAVTFWFHGWKENRS